MSGSQTTAGIPAAAAAVGYDTETFGPAVTVGSNWQKFNFYGVNPSTVNVTQNSDGSVTINPGGDNFGAQLSTASAGTGGKFSGIAFGGGGYFQATMSFNGPASFWANDIETMNGVSAGAGPNQWPGQATGYGNWIEADIAEFDSTGVYGFGIHNWYGRVGSGNDTNTGPLSGSPVYPPGANYSQPHTYGFLWVPATATSQGYAKFYFNGVQVGNTLTWNLYNPSAGPAPSISNGTAFSVLDDLHLALLLGTGSSTPNTVYNVQVWQASAANDISTLPTATPPPPVTPPTKVTPSANDTVVPAGSKAAITDASGQLWTITGGGQVAVNGTADTTTGNVIELAYVNGTIWQENASKLWWGETTPNGGWTPGAGTATSPLPTVTPPPPPKITPSANDTVVPAGSKAAITDASGNLWTITGGGQVAVNGTADTTTGNVIELAYVNGTIWQENASKLWWGETTSNGGWAPTAGTATSPLPASITIASGQASVTVSQSHTSVFATAGNHMLFISGTGDTVNLTGGSDTVTDTGGGNSFVLPPAGHGSDTFTGTAAANILTLRDTLDLRPALAATNWNGAASTLGGYLSVADTAQGAVLSVAAKSGGVAVAIATIDGATTVSLSSLLAHALT